MSNDAVIMVSNTFRTGKTSIFTLLHFAQMVKQKTFSAYNWSSSEENIRRYNISQPPVYDISSVDVPISIFWSEKDGISTFENVKRLMTELTNLKSVEKVELSHIDYLWGENAYQELYNKIVSSISEA